MVTVLSAVKLPSSMLNTRLPSPLFTSGVGSLPLASIVSRSAPRPMMVVLSVIVLRGRHPEWDRPYRVTGYPFTVIVFVLVSSAFVVNTLVGSARSSLMGLGLLLLGVPFYLRRRAVRT